MNCPDCHHDYQSRTGICLVDWDGDPCRCCNPKHIRAVTHLPTLLVGEWLFGIGVQNSLDRAAELLNYLLRNGYLVVPE